MIQRASFLQRGFTIVELLVVIVVIAILAAITIVSYNGITNQAYAAKAASVVDAYVNIIEIYQVYEGSYPVTNGPVCLGTAANFPAGGGFNARECAKPGSVMVSDPFNELLAEYSSQLPSGELPTSTADSITMRGMSYNGNETGGMILYLIKGDIACPKGSKVDMSGTTGCGIMIGAYDPQA